MIAWLNNLLRKVKILDLTKNLESIRKIVAITGARAHNLLDERNRHVTAIYDQFQRIATSSGDEYML